MWVIYKKEIRSFLSSLTAYIVMIVFLLITGLLICAGGAIGAVGIRNPAEQAT